jgi:hypothetical protein
MLLAWHIKQPFCNFRYDQRSLIKIDSFETLREQLEFDIQKTVHRNIFL